MNTNHHLKTRNRRKTKVGEILVFICFDGMNDDVIDEQ